MSYVEDNLMPNERILFRAKFSQAYHNSIVFLCYVFSFLILSYAIHLTNDTNPFSQAASSFYFLMFFAFFFTAIFLSIKAVVIAKTSEFGVTTRRVISKTGFIRRNTSEIILTKIESVGIDQNILGRLMNFGTIQITGTGGTTQRVKHIVDPATNRKKLLQVLEHVHSKLNTTD